MSGYNRSEEQRAVYRYVFRPHAEWIAERLRQHLPVDVTITVEPRLPEKAPNRLGDVSPEDRRLQRQIARTFRLRPETVGLWLDGPKPLRIDGREYRRRQRRRRP